MSDYNNKWEFQLDPDPDKTVVKLGGEEFPYVQRVQFDYGVDDVFPNMIIHVPPEYTTITCDLQDTIFQVGNKRFKVLSLDDVEEELEEWKYQYVSMCPPNAESITNSVREYSEAIMKEVHELGGISGELFGFVPKDDVEISLVNKETGETVFMGTATDFTSTVRLDTSSTLDWGSTTEIGITKSTNDICVPSQNEVKPYYSYDEAFKLLEE